MNLICLGGYRKRFQDIVELLEEKDKNILELCFGDIYVAEHCKITGRNWLGLDLNLSFVEFAENNGFNAERKDLMKIKRLPDADVCIMIGSIYHFAKDNCETIMSKMLTSSKKIIISEPVLTWSNRSGLIGAIAKKSANVGKGEETFRFNKRSFLSMLESLSRKFNFNYQIKRERGFDLIAVIQHD